jgi:8-oxo-dGTP pyrophosphatase MutT (NUDIX family)
VLIDFERPSRPAPPGQVASAVLVALYLPAPPLPQNAAELRVVLTRRRHDLSHHGGEISFPGGRQDPQDADLTVTALREAEEEIGLPRDEVTLLGALSPTSTFVSNYAITPFVGLLHRDRGQAWQMSALEVDAVLELPLAVLRDRYTRMTIKRRDVSIPTDAFVIDEHLIWGATARILDDLLRRTAALVGGHASRTAETSTSAAARLSTRPSGIP